MEANIDVKFKTGLGMFVAKLFRKGKLVEAKTIEVSNIINFADVQQGDVISANGVCTGSVDVRIDVATDPPTPDHRDEGNFHLGYDIL